MSNAATTPGFNCRITISFAFDKNGKKVAYRHSGSCAGMGRKIRMSVSDAEMFLAMDLANAW